MQNYDCNFCHSSEDMAGLFLYRLQLYQFAYVFMWQDSMN